MMNKQEIAHHNELLAQRDALKQNVIELEKEVTTAKEEKQTWYQTCLTERAKVEDIQQVLDGLGIRRKAKKAESYAADYSPAARLVTYLAKLIPKGS